MTETRELYHAGPPTLSNRQREVLALAAQGIGDKAIAREMGISIHTVKGHMTEMRARMGIIDNRVALVLEAIRRGEIEVDGITRSNGKVT